MASSSLDIANLVLGIGTFVVLVALLSMVVIIVLALRKQLRKFNVKS